LFQIIAFIVVVSVVEATTFISYSTGYFVQMPVYKCTFIEEFKGDPIEICTVENICAEDPRITSFEPDFSNELTLDNFIEKYDLMCASEIKKGAFGGVSFVGWALTLLWLPRYGDIYGRKKMMIVCSLVDSVVYSSVFWSKNYEFSLAISFTFGVFASIRL